MDALKTRSLVVECRIMFCQAECVKVLQEAMESGAHVWAVAPGLNPGQSAHFSGRETEVASRALPAQAGFKGCSGIFDVMIPSFPKDDTFLNTAASVESLFAWGTVISVPNTKKGTNYYEMKYDKNHHSPEEISKFITKVIGSKTVKEHLKRAFGLADREGVMHKRNISSHAASVQSLGRYDNNSDDDSISDDWSNYKIDDTDIAEEEDIPRPDAVNPYNGPHGLRPGIAYFFTAVLQ
eukprot:15327852-Ditylum_brightwellii.AAC.1